MLKNGQFTTVWDGGEIITTGTVDIDSGKVEAKFINTNDLGSIKDSYFEDCDGNMYEVCKTCHKYINIPKDDELESFVMVCSNIECESRKVQQSLL